MAFLVIQKKNEEIRYSLKKKMVSVGTESGFDVVVPSGRRGLVFTILEKDQKYFLMNSRWRIRVNGKKVTLKKELKSCDQIEWRGGRAVFLEGEFTSASLESKASLRSLEFLQSLSNDLNASSQMSRSDETKSHLKRVLNQMIEMADAEEGFLLADLEGNRKWKQVFSGKDIEKQIPILQKLILDQVFETQKPVFIESIIGHPLEKEQRITSARLFSVVCFPLLIANQVIGLVFLLTRTPGRSIKGNRILEWSLLATQALLMVQSYLSIQVLKKENTGLRGLRTSYFLDTQDKFSHEPGSTFKSKRT